MLKNNLFLITQLCWYSMLTGTVLVPIDNQEKYIDYNQLCLNVMPNMLKQNQLATIKNWIEKTKEYAYQDFDQRIGISWDNYWVAQKDSNVSFVKSDTIPKLVTIDGKDVEQFPQSFLTFPAIKKIVLETILPKCCNHIQKRETLPEIFYMQTFVLRSNITQQDSNKNQLVHWHRDTSEYDTIADYTLVLMLSDPLDNDGWDGGHLLIKNGLPNENNPVLKAVPQLNQGIFFDNNLNSHAVTKTIPRSQIATRDIMIINFHLHVPKL